MADHARVGASDRVNSMCKAPEIEVFVADYQTGVGGSTLVQSDKVAPVQRKHHPVILGGVPEYLWIGNFAIRITCVQSSQNVVSESAQFVYGWRGEVLVGVESHPRFLFTPLHSLGCRD
jgi:hypothetical protein